MIVSEACWAISHKVVKHLSFQRKLELHAVDSFVCAAGISYHWLNLKHFEFQVIRIS